MVDVVTSIPNPPSADPEPPLVGETNHRPDITGGQGIDGPDDPLAIGSTEPLQRLPRCGGNGNAPPHRFSQRAAPS